MHKRPSHLESCLARRHRCLQQRKVAKPHITRRRARFAKTQPMSCTHPLSRLKNRPADRDCAKPALASFVTNLTSPYQNGGRGESIADRIAINQPFFQSHQRASRWLWSRRSRDRHWRWRAFSLFPLLFFFFSWRSLGRRRRRRRRPAQIKVIPSRALAAKFPVLGDILPIGRGSGS